MHLTKALVSFGAALWLSAGAAVAQTEVKLGHVGAPGSLFAQSADLFAQRANAKLGSKAKVVVYGSSQLGSDGELLKKLKLGTVDLALPSTVMTSVAPEFGVFEMPYLVQDRGHAARIADAVVRPILGPIAEKASYHILGVWENGYREITNSKRPIVKPADLQGIKLRVPGGSLAREDVQGLRRQPLADGAERSVRGAADRRHGRAGEPAHSDLFAEIPGSAEVSFAHRPRLYAGLSHRRAQAGSACRPTCRRPSPTPPRRSSRTFSSLPPSSTAN